MKLIFCECCYDLFRLKNTDTICGCGASGGHYLEDGLNAEIYGAAIPIGIDNASFVRALREQPDKGLGKRFEAFVIPKECPTVRRRS